MMNDDFPSQSPAGKRVSYCEVGDVKSAGIEAAQDLLSRPSLQTLSEVLGDSPILPEAPFSYDDSELVQSPLPDLDLENEISQFTNDQGDLRRSLIKDRLDFEDPKSLTVLQECYCRWVLADLGIVIKKTTKTWTGSRSIHQTTDTFGDVVKEVEDENWTKTIAYKFSKARKRGNDMDAWRVSRKMRPLKDAIAPYCQPEDAMHRTRAIYVTLTVDPRMTDCDMASAWQHVGRWFNDFRSRLSKVTGFPKAVVVRDEIKSKMIPCKLHVLRSWEAHESGWPHIHAVICFEDWHWGIFRQKDDEGRETWRIKQKDLVEKAWPYGFCDVVALTPGTLEKNIENVLWYVAKNLSDMDYRLVRQWPSKRRLTQSLLWYFGLRSFSVSRSLTRAAPDDLMKPASIIQNRLDGSGLKVELVEWEFIGLVRRKDTDLSRDDWTKEYSEPPDWVRTCWKPWSYEGGLDLGWLSRGT